MVTVKIKKFLTLIIGLISFGGAYAMTLDFPARPVQRKAAKSRGYVDTQSEFAKVIQRGGITDDLCKVIYFAAIQKDNDEMAKIARKSLIEIYFDVRKNWLSLTNYFGQHNDTARQIGKAGRKAYSAAVAGALVGHHYLKPENSSITNAIARAALTGLMTYAGIEGFARYKDRIFIPYKNYLKDNDIDSSDPESVFEFLINTEEFKNFDQKFMETVTTLLPVFNSQFTQIFNIPPFNDPGREGKGWRRTIRFAIQQLGEGKREAIDLLWSMIYQLGGHPAADFSQIQAPSNIIMKYFGSDFDEKEYESPKIQAIIANYLFSGERAWERFEGAGAVARPIIAQPRIRKRLGGSKELREQREQEEQRVKALQRRQKAQELHEQRPDLL